MGKGCRQAVRQRTLTPSSHRFESGQPCFTSAGGQFPTEINVLTKKKRKIDFAVDILLSKGYNALVVVIGLSPNGKATDSDSVIVKVRILLAQRLTGIPVGIPVSFWFRRFRRENTDGDRQNNDTSYRTYPRFWRVSRGTGGHRRKGYRSASAEADAGRRCGRGCRGSIPL